ncbi:MAG: MBL fold metallo-hydrolase [Acidimicrobiales bacterium]|nr:MBL fold metallo-hydrolase [Acidimicrobiales bacterium]
MSSEPLARLVEHMPDGILYVPLPTPFPVGPVNCYVLLDAPVTVIDPGMIWADSTAQFEAALATAGRSVADVDQVLVTHGHPDHFGAAGWLADEADATVLCGRAEEPKLTGQMDRARMGGIVGRLGIPDDMQSTFRSFYEGVRELTHPVSAPRLTLLDDGDTLRAGGRDWQVHVTPGHSVGHASLYDPETRVLLSGDHLLACITPNPVLEPDPDSPDGRRRSLVEYLASLDRFIRLDPLLVLPGHGPRFCDVPSLTTSMRHHHDARADEILGIVERLGDATPYELSGELFPNIADFAVMLGVSEVVGHLDLLEDDGRLVRGTQHPQRYAAR